MTKAEHRRFRKMGHRKLARMVKSQAGQIQSDFKTRIELHQYIDWICNLSIWQWLKYKLTGKMPQVLKGSDYNA